MKYKVGDYVREGGPLGPVSEVVGFKDGKYLLVSLNGNGHGCLEEEYLKPFKRFEQISLFESEE